jgi:prophage antirepressor-like protein
MLTIFEKEGIVIRTVQVAGEAHFVAADLAEPLGIRNIRDKIRRLDPDEKHLSRISTSGQMREVTVLTEPGLISLILSCPKSRQKNTAPWRYRRWVTHEVLPQIRKTGVYRLEQQLLEVTNELEETTGQLDYVREELQYVESNRLYKVAFSIQSVRNRGSRAYQFVKQRIRYFHESLTWRENVPFIIRGQENVVRAFLNN